MATSLLAANWRVHTLSTQSVVHRLSFSISITCPNNIPSTKKGNSHISNECAEHIEKSSLNRDSLIATDTCSESRDRHNTFACFILLNESSFSDKVNDSDSFNNCKTFSTIDSSQSRSESVWNFASRSFIRLLKSLRALFAALSCFNRCTPPTAYALPINSSKYSAVEKKGISSIKWDNTR